MMSTASILPSHFGTPLTTIIPGSRYDSRGRQLSFVETEVQRLERMALVNASKSRKSSPTQSNQPPPPVSRASSPSPHNVFIIDKSRTKSVTEPCDPMELMANRLAEEYFSNSSDDSSPALLSDKVLYLTRKSFLGPTPPSSSSPSLDDYKRKQPYLSSIPEEDLKKSSLTANTSFQVIT